MLLFEFDAVQGCCVPCFSCCFLSLPLPHLALCLVGVVVEVVHRLLSSLRDVVGIFSPYVHTRRHIRPRVATACSHPSSSPTAATATVAMADYDDKPATPGTPGLPAAVRRKLHA